MNPPAFSAAIINTLATITMKTLEVEIDEAGNIHPVDATAHPPAGRTMLVWDTTGHGLHQLSASVFGDWLNPEEDAAWAYLQPDKS